MKSFTIEIDAFGNIETNLKGFEEKSPELAAIVEAVGGKVTGRKWAPGNHAHVHANGKTYHHSH
jgi:hypothetical protein